MFSENQTVISENGEYNSAAPARPLESMGAIDAYGGTVAAERSEASDARRNQTPKRTQPTTTNASEAGAINGHTRTHSMNEDTQDDNRSTTGTETDAETDAETDDEPTIRAHHSCASSETQSCCSVDTNDENEEEEYVVGADGDYAGIPIVHHPPPSSHQLIDRPHQRRRWTEESHAADSGVIASN